MENGKIVIDKIKFMDKQGRIKIDFKNDGDTNGGQFSGIYSEPADPVFYETMKSLRESAANILELPGDLSIRLILFAVTFHYSQGGRMGAIITSRFMIPDLGNETVIQTPMMKCYDGGNDEDKCFTEDTVKKLWALEKEARRYLAGERAQMNLFDGEQQPPEETPDAPALEEDVKMVEG